ncbi:MAG TPA: ATP-binding protein [Candidatus Sumerlaeota bacterium]|nr:MAG: Sensor protein ZraS [candidate division BRC1 bacterium ADurb.BinA292]HOE95210.1 ATP-binding protein [Candidatus Sumerlaeota bacterium]HOR28505.1 ATP-binding protein [Candidatus Sumerlaeota bacterium]HPK01432.1 ATP-binding protein [Candidatus Sumerlaeota bacterium]
MNSKITVTQVPLQQLIDVLDVGILVLGRDGQPDFSNAPARMHFGCTRHDDLVERWQQIDRELNEIPTDGQGAVACTVQLEVPGPVRARRLQLEFYPLNHEDCEGQIVLIRDREMLDAMETDLRLASRFRGLTRLYRAIAHDLKAPLNAMVINLELLKETINLPHRDASTQERKDRYVNILMSELGRLNRTLQLLLTQADLSTKSSERIDLGEILLDVVTLLTPQAKQQEISVNYHLPEEPVLIIGSEDWLKQAVLNITINALEAMDRGGRLTIRLHVKEHVATLLVEDTGSGISQEDLEKIWNMHFTTKSSGTGIGLYVSRSVIQSHGGSIDVMSVPGEGSLFRITLPTAGKEN